MIGTNRDELSAFVLGDARFSTIDDEGLVRWLETATPHIEAEAALRRYRAVRTARGESVAPRDLWISMGSDLVFRWPSLQFAAANGRTGAPTFVYLFSWASPSFDGVLGSCHALELPFVFGTLRRPEIAALVGADEVAQRLSRQMVAAWAGFAQSGDPSHPGIGTWLRWEPRIRPTMVFDTDVALAEALREAELEAWDAWRPIGAVGKALGGGT
jgi:para-nitrobenzyl esterase